MTTWSATLLEYRFELYLKGASQMAINFSYFTAETDEKKVYEEVQKELEDSLDDAWGWSISIRGSAMLKDARIYPPATEGARIDLSKMELNLVDVSEKK